MAECQRSAIRRDRFSGLLPRQGRAARVVAGATLDPGSATIFYCE